MADSSRRPHLEIVRPERDLPIPIRAPHAYQDRSPRRDRDWPWVGVVLLLYAALLAAVAT